jgi:hypothetical protein
MMMANSVQSRLVFRDYAAGGGGDSVSSAVGGMWWAITVA